MRDRNWSRGEKHSRAILSSPGWDKYCRERQLSQATLAARVSEPDPTKGWLLLAQKAWGTLKIENHLLRTSRYNDHAIQQQLREHWIAGYVQALRDVKQERERMEEASYQNAFPIISTQEARHISAWFTNRMTERNK